jgi:hypothetical protein
MGWLQPKTTRVKNKGGHGSGGLGIGQNRYPSVENKFTDNLSVDRHGSVGRVW